MIELQSAVPNTCLYKHGASHLAEPLLLSLPFAGALSARTVLRTESREQGFVSAAISFSQEETWQRTAQQRHCDKHDEAAAEHHGRHNLHGFDLSKFNLGKKIHDVHPYMKLRGVSYWMLRRYPDAKAEIPELVSVKHVFVKEAARLTNRAENNHQPTRERERRMRGFCDPKRTQEFLSYYGPIRQHFALERHLLRASLYRKQLAARFASRREFAELAQNPSTTF